MGRLQVCAVRQDTVRLTTVFFLGGFSAAVTTPLDVVKTRIMLADRKVVQSGSLTFVKTFKKVLKKEGIKG